MQPGPIHEALDPLKFLIGRWLSVEANGKFLPNVQPFAYCEELQFVSIGQPMLNYSSTTWHPVKKTPMHLETGFLRIKPNTTEISFLVAHNFGLTSIEEGNIIDNEVILKNKNIERMSFTKEPKVTQIERRMKLKDNSQLEVITYMATTANPILSEHLLVTYEKQ